MEQKNKKKIIYTVTSIGFILVLVVGITYAYWLITKQQTNENVIITDCFKVSFTETEGSDIILNDAYPIKKEELNSYLSNQTPYQFTIENQCDNYASATINLESLQLAEKKLSDDWVDAILYEGTEPYQESTKILSDESYKLIENYDNTANKVIKNAEKAYALYELYLGAKEEKTFNLQLFLDPDTPAITDNMNATWKGKITLTSSYVGERFKNSGTLRKINSDNNYRDPVTHISHDTDGMWRYWQTITKIVIQDKIRPIKNATYGPFYENEDNTVVSYVKCDEENSNCTGYLQGDGGIKLNEDSSFLFAGFTSLTSIEGMENLDTSNVTIMKYMFASTGLQSLDLSSFNTSNVTDMEGMFNYATKLKKLDISSFDTSNVTNMSSMFSSLYNIQELDVSHFDTSKVTDMSAMFGGSYILTLNLSGKFNTSQVTNMSEMFASMTFIQKLDLSNFDTSNVTDMNRMFSYTQHLRTIIFVENFNTHNVTNMSYMFDEAGLMTLNLDFDTSQVTDMSYMFHGMYYLENLDISSFDTSQVTNMNSMFNKSAKLTEITYGENFVHKSDATTSKMFEGCPAPKPNTATWAGVFD